MRAVVIMARLLLATSAAATVAGCNKSGPARRAAVAKTLVRFTITPPEAEIWVNGRFVATAREATAGIRMPVGTHEIEVTLAGYFPYMAVLELGAQPADVAATLFPVVP